MLFHVTMKHSAEDCPAYHREKMPAIMKAFENLEETQNALKVKQHFFVWCPPSHTAYLLVEADNLNAVSRYVFAIPFPHDTQIVPVEHLQETMSFAKAMMEQSTE